MPQADGTLRVSHFTAGGDSQLMFVPDETHIAGTRPYRFAVFLPDAPQGDTPQGDTPQGDTPQGDTPQGDTPQGDTPQGDTPQGSASYARSMADGEVRLQFAGDVTATRAIRDVALDAAARGTKVTVHVEPKGDQLVVQAISIPARPAHASA